MAKHQEICELCYSSILPPEKTHYIGDVKLCPFCYIKNYKTNPEAIRIIVDKNRESNTASVVRTKSFPGDKGVRK